MTPLVDVIIAARNESTFLARALDALRQQTYDPNRLAITVVDSNSTDATAEIALGAGVTVLRESKPGAAAARNRGIRHGRGELIAFLDAHCLPNREWVATMVRRFSDSRLGGCQGRIDNRSTDARVQNYLESSGAFANERVVEDTVSGKRNLYPWILSGNSMFRRSAVEAAGLFEEALQACEDVDLAWRIFLLGYQLGYEPQAEVVHYDLNAWSRFVRKGAVYGAGAASLALAYGAHGASNKFAPPPLRSRSVERTLAIGYYWSGYYRQRMRLRLGLARPLAARPLRDVHDEFRPTFSWTDDRTMRVSPSVLFWFRDEDQASVIVNPATRVRWVLESVADFIWRGIVDATSRTDLAHRMSTFYNVSAATAEADLDEFIEELQASGVIVIA
jgi:cellulose synthase/poly-beta-1,6-N-acetylglucosamine synthase-like glycosyltransferase